MDTQSYIDFVTSLLSKMHIDSHVLVNPDEHMASSIDGGLRAMLFGEDNYAKLLVNSPTQAKSNVIYRFFDEYLCHYIFFRIPDANTNSYFYIGPYIPVLPTEDFLSRKARQLALKGSQLEQLTAYYRNLPVVEDDSVLMCVVDTLGAQLWGGANYFDVEYVSYEIPDRRSPVYTTGLFDHNDSTVPSMTLEMVEQNYLSENKLMEAVRKGKMNKIEIITAAIMNKGTEKRLPDSLRNRKNYLIILNTLLRKAAEYGEVHPFHIDRLSSRFARKIEELRTVDSSLNLQQEMMRKYCLLVKEHSLKKYSNLIGRVITLISYDLAADLSLKHIASLMNVNASYLSATFKKECGMTLTDYVHSKRMEAAVYILAHSDKQIQTVAEECGILDVNYFIKVFKKHYGMTPTQYRAMSI